MLRPRFNLWIEKEGQVVISRWRAHLLRAIDQSGSITAAAAELNVPYRRAWERLHEMESKLEVKLVETEVGGSSGGGASLTPEGRALLKRFETFSEGFEELVAVRFQQSFPDA
jgi:molybdate transport system regulatory protein